MRGIEKSMVDNEMSGTRLAALRVAVVHEWLMTYAGSAQEVDQILHKFPHADVFIFLDSLPHPARGMLGGRSVTTSFLQGFPGVKQQYRLYLPLMPLAIEQLDVSAYDVVISSSTATAKGVLTGPDQLHVCYCHTPMRYAWDLQHQYLSEMRRGRWLARGILHYMRLWDSRTGHGVNQFVANSRFVGRRIRKTYGCDSVVIYPPVRVHLFEAREERDTFYVTVSRFVPYKKMDLIIEAFNQRPERTLIVIGTGPGFQELAERAGSNVTLLGFQPFEVVKDHLERARAFVFAAQEDFGIVTVEAQAAGAPVIAYGRGGSTETVVHGETGILFPEQSVSSLKAAVDEFESGQYRFETQRIRENANRFSIPRFREAFLQLMEREWIRFEEKY